MAWALIQSQTLGASAANVTFSAIPQTYKALKLIVSARSDTAGVTTTLVIAPNASATSLTFRRLTGDGTTAASASGSTGQIGDVDAASASGTAFGSAEITIPNYAGSATKAMTTVAVTEHSGTPAMQDMYASLWSNTAAITSLVVSPGAGNFIANSSFTLYGLA